jgi:hypothetical protein
MPFLIHRSHDDRRERLADGPFPENAQDVASTSSVIIGHRDARFFWTRGTFGSNASVESACIPPTTPKEGDSWLVI